MAQCYHYMAVLGAEAWYIAVVIYGREFKFVKIERDEQVIQNLIQIEEQFWNHHVLTGIMPEPDGSDAAERFINSYFKDSREDSAVPLLGFDDKLKRRCEIVALMDRLTTEKKQIEQEIKAYMQDAELAENDNFFVSWKQTASQRLDSARLKAEMPEIYQQFCKQNQSRRLIVKSLREVA